jgi:type VI secretion system protein ImpB
LDNLWIRKKVVKYPPAGIWPKLENQFLRGKKMADEGSVAPKERINIVYKPATGDAKEDVELPLKLLVVGDFTQAEDSRQVENRQPISIDKDNFNDVLKSQNLSLNFTVPNSLSEQQDDSLAVNLHFNSLSDFEPDQLVKQVEPLRKLMQLREALKAVKSPISNIPQFRKQLQAIIDDDQALEKLLGELGLDKEEK